MLTISFWMKKNFMDCLFSSAITVFCVGSFCVYTSVPDLVETLLPLLSKERTRRQVVTQLVSMGLVDSVKDLKKERYVGIVQLILFSLKENLCNLLNSLHCIINKLLDDLGRI